MSRDTDQETKSVDHELRQLVTDFVWSPNSDKKRQIVRLLDRYQDHWQLKGK